MAAIPLEWKASIVGIEDVKARLAEIRAEYKRGEIGVEEFGKKQRFLASQARAVNQTMSQQKSLFLALHPSIQKASNAISIFGSVSRAALTIMNALNLATLASQGFNQQLSDINIKVIEQRKVLRQLEEAGFGPGDAVFDEAIALMNEYEAAMKAVQKQAEAQDFNNLITDLFGVSLAAGTTIQTIIKLLPFLTKFKSLSLGGGALTGGLIAGTAGFAALALGVAFAAEELFKFILGLEDMDAWREQNQKALVDLFLVHLPEALVSFASLFVATWEDIKRGVFGVINSLIGGFETLINGFVRIINTFITAYNRIADKLGLGKLGKLNQITLPRVGGGESEGTSGTGANKAVPFADTEFAKSAGGQVIINVQGSILSENELEGITSNALKARLKRAGFGT